MEEDDVDDDVVALPFRSSLTLDPQKKSSAYSESESIKTRFHKEGGTKRSARFMPRAMAATSLDFRDGIVRRAMAFM